MRAKLTSHKFSLAILVGATVLFLVLATGAALTKAPEADEGWFASPALNLITRGFMGTSVLEPSGILTRQLKGINQYTYWVMPLHLVAQAGWYKLFGFSLFSMRTLSILWGLVALAAWFLIIKKLTGESAAATLAFVFIACDYIFIMHAAFGRMDMMCAALGFAALAAYLSLREKDLRLALFVSHVLVVASGLTHPNGVMALAGLIFLTLYFDRSSLRWRHLPFVAAPYLVGAVAWGLYILRSPASFVSQFGDNATGRLPGIFSPLQSLKLEFTDKYLEAFGFASYSNGLARLKIFILIAYLVGIVGALAMRGLRQQKGARALLILWAIYFVIETFFNHKLVFYLIHIIPLYAAVLAVWVHYCWSRRVVPGWIVAGGVACLLTLQVGAVAYRIKQNDYRGKYLPAVEFVRGNSTPSTLTMSSAEMAFGLGFDHVIDDLRLGYYSGKRPDFVVVGTTYEGLFGTLRTKEPVVYEHVQKLLTEQCRVAYEREPYKIYDCR
ncbi:MAG TPA: glycosyltransferase family 39 protein [Pyrinomonadaceae bacterium]